MPKFIYSFTFQVDVVSDCEAVRRAERLLCSVGTAGRPRQEAGSLGRGAHWGPRGHPGCWLRVLGGLLSARPRGVCARGALPRLRSALLTPGRPCVSVTAQCRGASGHMVFVLFTVKLGIRFLTAGRKWGTWGPAAQATVGPFSVTLG